MSETQTGEYEIRVAAREDAARMVQFLEDILDEGLDVIHPPRLTVEEEEEELRRCEENGRSFFLLALRGDRVLGLLNLAAGGRPFSRHAGNMGISVLEDARGAGLGTRLMEEMERICRGWPDFCRIELEVHERNKAAHALYKRLGYVEEGVKRKSANTTGTPEDTILMAKVW